MRIKHDSENKQPISHNPLRFLTTFSSQSPPSSNMADEPFGSHHFPRLEDLCVKVVGVNSSHWKPEQLLGNLPFSYFVL